MNLLNLFAMMPSQGGQGGGSSVVLTLLVIIVPLFFILIPLILMINSDRWSKKERGLWIIVVIFCGWLGLLTFLIANPRKDDDKE